MSEDKKNKAAFNKDIVLEALMYQQGGMRRGTAKMKTRSEVSGGGAKPWRQKGTGRARQGSTRAVQWVGGGRAFGSSQRSYVVKMNKKARAAALRTLLLAKKAEGKLFIDALACEEPSTKKFASFLSEKEITGKVLFLYSADTDRNAVKSARNLPFVKMLHFDRINVKDLLNNDWLLVSAADEAKLRLQDAQGE